VKSSASSYASSSISIAVGGTKEGRVGVLKRWAEGVYEEEEATEVVGSTKFGRPMSGLLGDATVP